MSYFSDIAPQLAAAAFNPANYNPWAGVSMLPKSQSNFGAAAPAIATNRLPIDMMNAITNAGSAASEAQYRSALGQAANIQSQIALQNLGFMRQMMSGMGGDFTPQPQGSSAAPGVNAAPTGVSVGSPAPAASTSTSSGGAFGPYAQPVVAQLRNEGWTDAAISGALANGQAEGGFNQPWQKSPGKENSYGIWQYNDQGELPGYQSFVKSLGDPNANPQDPALQARYFASRMEEISPGFGQITDPKAATDIIQTQFEKPAVNKPGQRYGQLMLAQNYLANTGSAPGPQYAQANTGTATDATATPGTLITNGGVPGITANRAQGTPTPNAQQLVAAGVNPPNAATTNPTFAGAPTAAVPNAPAPAAATSPGTPMPMGGQSASAAPLVPGGALAAPYMPYTPQQIQRAAANAQMFAFMGKPVPPQIQQILSFGPGGANDPQAIATRAQAEASIQLQAKLAENGMMRDASGNIVPIPGYNPAVSATAAAKTAGNNLLVQGPSGAYTNAPGALQATAAAAAAKAEGEQGPIRVTQSVAPQTFRGAGSGTFYPPGSPVAPAIANIPQNGQPAGTAIHPTGNGGVTVENMNPASETIGKNFETLDKMGEAADAARQTLYQAKLLQSRLNAIGTSGPLTQHLGDLSALARQVGVPDETLKSLNIPSAPTVQEANAISLELLGSILRQTFPTRITNTDIGTFKPSNPNVNMLGEASNYLINNIVVPKAQRDIERYGAATTLPQSDPQTFKKQLYDWDQAHPYESYAVPTQPAGKPIDAATLGAANAAIAKGAPRAAVMQRLQQNGFDTSKF